MNKFVTREEIEAEHAAATRSIAAAAQALQKAADVFGHYCTPDDLAALRDSTQQAVDGIAAQINLLTDGAMAHVELLEKAYAIIEAQRHVLSAVVRAVVHETGETQDGFAEKIIHSPAFKPQCEGVEDLVRGIVGAADWPGDFRRPS